MSMDKNTVDKIVSIINKQFGPNTLVRLSEQSAQKCNVISTGSLLLNKATGINGYPLGRIVEIFGPEMSGKTTLALMAIASAQKQNKLAAFIDAEHALDIEYAKQLGVKLEDMYLVQPDYGEQALDIIEALLKEKVFGIIVVDSIPALVPKAELEGTMEDQSIGLQARLMSKALRKLSGLVSDSNTLLLLINQIRYKIGGMPYQNPETTPGGAALKFYASMRVEVRKGANIKIDNQLVGHVMNCTIKKNKLAVPYTSVSLNLIYGKGIDTTSEVLELALESKLIEQSGPWYKYKDQQFQGKDKLIAWLKDNPDELNNLTEQLDKISNIEIPKIDYQDLTTELEE